MTDPLKEFGSLFTRLLGEAGMSPELLGLIEEMLTPEERRQTEERWWEELEFSRKPTLDKAKKAYRRLVKQHHPDVEGGDTEWKTKKLARLHAAIAKAKEELE